MGSLKASFLKEDLKPGKYSDGDGLYLVVSKSRHRSWAFRYMMNGARREMGLGSAARVNLSAARDAATKARALIVSGLDPLLQKKAKAEESRRQEKASMTFEQCALEFISHKKPSWRYYRQAQTWENSLKSYVFPHIGDTPIKDITVQDVTRVLRPIWTDINHTAGKVQNRIENILDYATAYGYRSGDNPARWKGTLEYIMPADGEYSKVRHHESMPYAELPAFYSSLIASGDKTSLAMAFLILTATRTQECLGARWAEIDMESKIWTIPAERMKNLEVHQVPLSEEAIRIVQFMRSRSENQYLFPGRISAKHLSNMALLMLMRRLGRKEVPHGFRSTFKNWSSEVYGAEDDVSEAALSHKIKNKVKAAYLRGKFIDKRRELMSAWAEYCLGRLPLAANVGVDINSKPSL